MNNKYNVMSDDELITEQEWFRRIFRTDMYKILSFDFTKGTTIVDTYTGEIFIITAEKINGRLWLRVHKLG